MSATKCKRCKGDGFELSSRGDVRRDDWGFGIVCDDCDGTGKHQRPTPSSTTTGDAAEGVCRDCNGSGMVDWGPGDHHPDVSDWRGCEKCNATGRVRPDNEGSGE